MTEPATKKMRNLLLPAGILVACGLVGASYLMKVKEVAQREALPTESSSKSAVAPKPRTEASPSAPQEGKPVPDGAEAVVDKWAQLEKIRKSPHVYYRSVRPKEFGRIVVADLKEPEKERFVTKLKCNRAYFDRKGGICLVDNRAQHKPLAYALLVDEHFEEVHRIDLAGFPSRTRLSPDGLFAATTVFTAGDDYEAEFSTRTMAIDRLAGEGLPDLEQFEVFKDGKQIEGEDFNFWGITYYDDSNLFHATLRTGDQTYLLKGDQEKRRVEVLRDNVECPSLSPDRKNIAFKKLIKKPGEWRVHVMDLATLKDYAVTGEGHSVDDQMEWYDDEHLLYGTIMDRGAPHDAMNVWRTPIKGGKPELFLAGAASPSVVR